MIGAILRGQRHDRPAGPVDGDADRARSAWTAAVGPDALRAPGLTVQPGQTIDIRFSDGDYGLTVVADVPERDATVEAFTPTCEADPDDSICIDDDVVSR
jgi:hypothetical protein